MAETMYLLDFRRNTVEVVDASVPPENVLDPSDSARLQREGIPHRTGYILAALGSPPDSHED